MHFGSIYTPVEFPAGEARGFGVFDALSLDARVSCNHPSTKTTDTAHMDATVRLESGRK